MIYKENKKKVYMSVPLYRWNKRLVPAIREAKKRNINKEKNVKNVKSNIICDGVSRFRSLIHYRNRVEEKILQDIGLEYDGRLVWDWMKSHPNQVMESGSQIKNKKIYLYFNSSIFGFGIFFANFIKNLFFIFCFIHN